MAQYIIITSGESTYGLTLGPDNPMIVYSSGIADDIIVNSGGSALVTYGVNRTTVNSSGQMHISSGGSASNTTMTSDGALVIEGYASGITLNDGGMAYVHDGALVEYVVATAGGGLAVSGGVVNDIHVNSGGNLIVSGGTVAGDILKNANVFFDTGANYVFDLRRFSAGVQIAKIQDWAQIEGRDNANYFVSVLVSIASGEYTLAGNASGFNKNISVMLNDVYAGTISVGGPTLHYDGKYYSLDVTQDVYGYLKLTVEDDGVPIYVSSGQSRTGDILVDKRMYVLNGGFVSNTGMNAGGFLTLSSGGSAETVKIEAGGRMDVSKGGFVESASAYGFRNLISQTDRYWADLNVFSGGVAIKASANDHATIFVDSSASVENVRTRSSWIFVKGSANEMFVDASSVMYVYSGGIVEKTSANGGIVNVLDDAVVNSMRMIQGWMNVYGNAVVNSTSQGGLMNIFSGGTANDTKLNYGELTIYNGGIANNITVTKECTVRVFSGGTANSMTVSNGILEVYDEGSLRWATVLGGTVYISSGAFVNGMAISCGNGAGAGQAVVNVLNGGTVDSATVDATCLKNVSLGGVALNTTMLSGKMGVLGGTAVNTIVSHGSMEVKNDGILRSATINSGGKVSVDSGKAININVNAGGTLSLNGYSVLYGASVASGGSLWRTVILLLTPAADPFSATSVSRTETATSQSGLKAVRTNKSRAAP